MLISASVWQALTEAGVTLVPRGVDRVELSYAGARALLTVVSSPTPLSPSNIASLTSRYPERCLIVVPAASPAVRQAVDEADWSWLVDTGQQVTGTVRVNGVKVVLRSPPQAATRPAKRGPVPWGTLTLVRRMLQRPYASQRELAALAGVSQPRVSQALNVLADQELVRRTPNGWVVRDIDEAIRWWLESYPGPGGISTRWYGMASAVEQARTVVALVGATDPTAVVVSGDVGADVIAPWRAPIRAVLYGRTGANLEDAGLVPAGGDEATLEFNVPRDPGLWQPSGSATPVTNSLPLADPLQILWDVRRSPGPDSEEAAHRVWDVLRRRHRDRRDVA
ncbi:hypothetical protein F6X68_12625 [Micromonospora sp. AMSO12t]|uniref:MarR family transcriptional regulator n=1 Tax=Micromonospora sp. AMSO12t TaxID=2650410 RepID=UPI00124B037F|nr:MarR family transcriptional regulator [Micromonospora sp. AMSO12t]KAB1155124.1 hypothetical protein F6X68_12625 [Micromonospora sp. AMSO12t]